MDKSIMVLLILFVALGIVFPKYNKKISLLVFLVAVSMVIYVTIKN
jgi:hypothetical protein